MRSSFLTVLSVLPFLSPAQSITAAKQYNFDLVSANVAPDGFTRSAALVNGQFPGPVITANKGQDIRVTVNNKLSDPSMRRSSSIVSQLIRHTAMITNLLLALAWHCMFVPPQEITVLRSF